LGEPWLKGISFLRLIKSFNKILTISMTQFPLLERMASFRITDLATFQNVLKSNASKN
jgi:hypothetical protein